MAITNLPTALTSAGNQGDAGDYSTAASTIFQIDYSGLDYTPKTTDDYKNDFEEELQVFINGTRIYRTATDTGIDDTGGLSTAQKSRLTNLNSSFGDKPWNIVTGTKKVQINQNHTAFSDSNSNNPGYPDLSTWTIIKVIRIKPDKTALATDFQSASVLTEAELDNAFSETFHMAQEAIDTSLDSIVKGADNIWDAQSLRIKNVATPVNANDAVNKSFVDQNGNVSTVAGLSSEIARLGTSAMATATTGHIPVLANVVEQTVNYTVTVANSKFNIQGGEYGSATETPALTLIRGYTYVFDTSDSTVANHPLVFKNGSATLGTSDGVTTDSASPGSTGAKVTVVVSDSVTITKYSCSTHGDGMGNTITLRHDDFKEVADVASNVTTVAGVASSIPTVAGINSEITTVANSGYKTDIETVADSTYKAKVETVGDSAYKAKVETVADSTYKAKVETVAGDTTAINSIHTNISQVTTFADTYHSAGTTEPSGSNVGLGDLWFDTSANVLKVYGSSGWASASSSIATVASQNEFTASDGQGTGNKYFALNHDVGLELVFLNGVRLKRGSDYYCTNSNTSTTPITSGNAATFVRLETVPGSSDILSVMAFGQIANNLAVNTAGGTFTGGVTFEAGTTHNTGSNTFTMPTTRGTNAQVLTRTGTSGATSWSDTLQGPTISGIKYSNQTSGTFVENSGQTATDPTGGDLVQLTGQNFDSTQASPADSSNVAITIDGTSATSISVNSAGTEVTFTAPAKSAGSYTLTATNATGLNANTTISYDATPAWVTASAPSSSLGNFVDGSITGTNGPQIVASESGSNLTTGYKRVTSNTDNTVITTAIAGLTLGDNGYLTGTLAGTNGADNSFYAVAHDNEGQQSAIRLFKFVSYDYPGNGGATTSTYNIGGTDYVVHVFQHTGLAVGTASSAQTFKLIEAKTCDILLVAGGGGGGGMGWAGSNGAGGGGAGGFVYYNQKSLSAGDYSIVVGYGGHGMSSSQDATNGGNSTFTGLTSAVGGGKGGGYDGSNNQGGANGGSGGGGGLDDGTYGSGTTNQGNNAGNASWVIGGVTYGTAGGGGGASGGGSNGSAGGNGGAGYTEGATVYNWTAGSGTVTFPTYFQNGSSNVSYAGGGGGGRWGTSGSGVTSGGAGGGGNGGRNGTNGESGANHLGGGGGGGGDNDSDSSTVKSGGNGGSGIVIVRYAI